MILYNVTVSVDNAVADQWKEWMSTIHIPDVMATGRPKEYRLLKLLNATDDTGTTYCVQYLFEDMESYIMYRDLYAPDLQKDHQAKFGNKAAAFRTLLQLVEKSN